MNANLSPDDPFAALRSCLQAGIRASHLCVAIMGWLCNHSTVPSVAETKLQGGQVWLRLSDEDRLEPVMSFLEFLDQVRIVCVSIGLTDAQTAQVVARARHLLG
jgi:hypothetical protein